MLSDGDNRCDWPAEVSRCKSTTKREFGLAGVQAQLALLQLLLRRRALALGGMLLPQRDQRTLVPREVDAHLGQVAVGRLQRREANRPRPLQIRERLPL